MARNAREGRYRRLLLLTWKEERICRENLVSKQLLTRTNFLTRELFTSSTQAAKESIRILLSLPLRRDDFVADPSSLR